MIFAVAKAILQPRMELTPEITLENLSKVIKERAKNKNPFVIVVSGFGGAGKTTLAIKLAKSLGQADIIHLDDFIINRLTERSPDWAGFDWERLTNEVLLPASRRQKKIEYGIYDWVKNKVLEKRILHLKKYIIIEGVGLIKKQLKKYFDVSVWIDIPLKVASERGKKRDSADHEALWDDLWTSNDRDYYEKYQPKNSADFIVC